MATRLQSGDQLAAHNGLVVELAGLYKVQNIFPRKIVKELPDGRIVQSSKVVHLALSDDTTVRLWVRPDDEMSSLAGRHVVATGKLVMPGEPPPSHMAAPDETPSLLDITAVVAT